MISKEKQDKIRKEYIRQSSLIRVEAPVIYHDKLMKITDISPCMYQGKKLESDFSCEYCVGRIGLDYELPRCLSNGLKLLFKVIEEEFLTMEEMEL